MAFNGVPLENERFITAKELLKILPYSRFHIDRLEKNGQFPKRIKFTSNRVAWRRSEIEQWIREREEKEVA